MFDSTLCCVAGLISLSAFGTIKGLGEGTVISALLVGYIITGISSIFLPFNGGKELLHSDH